MSWFCSSGEGRSPAPNPTSSEIGSPIPNGQRHLASAGGAGTPRASLVVGVLGRHSEDVPNDRDVHHALDSPEYMCLMWVTRMLSWGNLNHLRLTNIFHVLYDFSSSSAARNQ